MKNPRILGVVILLAILGLSGYKYYSYKHPEVVEKALKEAEVHTAITESTSSSPSSSSTRFTVEVDNPVNPTKTGVIEVGASGFNCFVANIDKSDNWSLDYKEFGESLAYEGFMSLDDVKVGLRKYIGTIAEHGVNGKNIHFVMSSGALKNPKTIMVAEAIRKMGYVVNTVGPTQEGQFAFMALVPKNYRDNSFTIDIGSGNTKVSWYENGRIKSLEGPGAKYTQNNMSNDEAYQQICKLVDQVPVERRDQCFIIGGAPFKMAKESRNGEERFTLLKAPSDYNASGNDKMIAGINIYKAIFDSSKTDKFIFDWDSNFTIGFLLTLN